MSVWAWRCCRLRDVDDESERVNGGRGREGWWTMLYSLARLGPLYCVEAQHTFPVLTLTATVTVECSVQG